MSIANEAENRIRSTLSPITIHPAAVASVAAVQPKKEKPTAK
jgi:hypothetical protein